jgi:hypothetical protein
VCKFDDDPSLEWICWPNILFGFGFISNLGFVFYLFIFK